MAAVLFNNTFEGNGELGAKLDKLVSFKGFWRKNALRKPLQFIQYKCENADIEDTKKASADQTICHCKKTYGVRHRHEASKADYVKALEQEVNSLRETNVLVRQENARLAVETKVLFEVATAQGCRMATLNEATSTPSNWNTYATIGISFDDDLKAERSFAKRMDDRSIVLPQASNLNAKGPDNSITVKEQKEESILFSAVDFILALEHCCRTHIHYPWESIANISLGVIQKPTDHVFTTTACLYSYGLPFQQTPEDKPHHNPSSFSYPDAIIIPQPTWRITYADMQKIIEPSRTLFAPEGDMTPVEAFHLIKSRVPLARLGTVLETLKVELGNGVRCWGFGAAVEVEKIKTALARVG